MKQIVIALTISALLVFTVMGGDGIVRTLTSQTVSVGHNAATDSAMFLFPLLHGSYGKPYLDGNVCINIKTNKANAGSATDSLTLTIRDVQLIGTSYIISRASAITLVTNLNWDSSYTYSYPIEDAFGPCDGLEVYVSFAAAGANDTVNVIVTPKVQ